MINIKNLDFKYPRTNISVLNIQYLKIKKEGVTGIVGKTGSGKSTLIELLSGINRPSSGEIKILDYSFNNRTKLGKFKSLHKEIGMVFQNSDDQFIKSTVLEEILYAPNNFRYDRELTIKEIYKLCDSFHFDINLLQQNPINLSGGQKRIVAIMSILILKPKVLILDEPTIGLDPLTKYQLMSHLVSFGKLNDAKIIFVSHNPELIDIYADNVLYLNNGKVVYEGSKLDYFNYCVNNNELENIPPHLYAKIRLEQKFDLKFNSISEVYDYVKRN